MKDAMKYAHYTTKHTAPEGTVRWISVQHQCPNCVAGNGPLSVAPMTYRSKFDVKEEEVEVNWDVNTVVWLPFEEKWLCVLCRHEWEDDLKWVVDKLEEEES